MSETFYFSNYHTDKWFEVGNTLNVILVPKKWWSIKEWRVARELQKNFKITGISKREDGLV